MKLFIYSIAAIAATTFLYHHLKNVETDYTSQLQTDGTQQNFAHVYKNFSLTNTGVKGDIQSQILSPHTNYSASEHKTIISQPEMMMHRNDAAPIAITAESADVFHNNHITVLQDNVIVTMTEKSSNTVTLTTEELTIDNISQIAHSDMPAKISHGNGKMHGTGLEFNPHNKQIKFLSNVRGSYEY